VAVITVGSPEETDLSVELGLKQEDSCSAREL
jgi:hypothetical protein